MNYDVVIVGGGSAGVVLATRLSEDPSCTVALLEAGADYVSAEETPDAIAYLGSYRMGPLEDDNYSSGREAIDWQFVARATSAHPVMTVPRGKALGGTSSINGPVLLRATEDDFASWVAAGNPEWSYEQVLPYYAKIETDLDFHEDYHGSTGPEQIARLAREQWNDKENAFAEAAVALGYPECDDLNSPGATGVGPTPTNSRDKQRLSTARIYLPLARERANLTIISNTLVRRVLFEGTRATAVETDSGERIVGNSIVLSAGAIKSPHLLLLSGVGPAAQLASFDIPVVVDLAGVGSNLCDHPAAAMLWRDRTESSASSSKRPYRQGATLRLWFSEPDSATLNDCCLRSFGGAAGQLHPELDGFSMMYADISLANSRGSLRLQSSDPNVQPLLDYDLLSDEGDRRRMRTAIETALEMVAQPSLKSYVGELIEPTPLELSPAALEEWMMRRVRTSHHVAGTCKLGSDSEAVVDVHGRVHGLDNLWVCDASIMPNGTRANTNKTTIMIAERTADVIKEQVS